MKGVDSKQVADVKAVLTRTYKVMGYAFASGLLIAYFVQFRAYKNALVKHHSLTELLYNPNARVAAGDQAKNILLHL